MKEFMYNIQGEEVEIEENENGATVKTEAGVKKFKDFEKAIAFLEKMGYRF